MTVKSVWSPTWTDTCVSGGREEKVWSLASEWEAGIETKGLWELLITGHSGKVSILTFSETRKKNEKERSTAWKHVAWNCIWGWKLSIRMVVFDASTAVSWHTNFTCQMSYFVAAASPHARPAVENIRESPRDNTRGCQKMWLIRKDNHSSLLCQTDSFILTMTKPLRF